MRSCSLLLLAAFMAAGPAFAQDEAEVTKLLNKLKSEDIEARHAAMLALQTSLDPRIPEACLPALQTEGDSIRRLAARAIGSRWHQVPKERVADFMQALKPHLQSEHDGLVNMARRGLALLGRDYKDAMVSRSKSKRWVVYERHGLPCIIDTENSTEELLGFDPDPQVYNSFMPAWGNSEVAPSVFWHPKQDMVALHILTSRKSSEGWIWRHGHGLRKFTLRELAKILGHQDEEFGRGAGFFFEIQGWKGSALNFTLDYALHIKGAYISYQSQFQWDSALDKLTVISSKSLD